MPSPVRFAVVRRALERAGWILIRITGSHHVFRHPETGESIVVPVHGNLVKYGYIRRIEKDFGVRCE
jgi:predicted RNA binding protein YcfA (HicA-like mRNA interferase family)